MSNHVRARRNLAAVDLDPAARLRGSSAAVIALTA
jgi:hypothetical protein